MPIDKKRYAKKLEELIEIQTLLSSQLETGTLLQSIALSALALLDAESAELWQCKSGNFEAGNGARLRLLAAEGTTATAEKRAVLHLPAEAIESEDGKPFVVRPRKYFEEFFSRHLPQDRTKRGKRAYQQSKSYGRSVLSCIFSIHGEARGLLSVSRQTKRPFQHEDDYFLERLANLAGICLQNSTTLEKTRAEFARAKQDLSFLKQQEELLGDSPALEALRERIRKAAPSKASVLILGERGTGKEILANLLHIESNRRDGPLVKINCAGLSEELLESELFGYEKGAFTGAEKTTQGLFEAADRGTLFLDEIAEMSPNLQARLLRVLQEGRIRKVGGREEIAVDVRIIAATNQDILSEGSAKRFRRDLLDRISTIILETPPLRTRPEDIELLCNYFLHKYELLENRSGVPRLSKESLRRLKEYSWPGNVRELENLMHKYVILGDESALFESLARTQQKTAISADPGGTNKPSESLLDADESKQTNKPIPKYKEAKAAFEKGFIQQALAFTRGNIAQAARASGLDRKNFKLKMQRYGIRADDFRGPSSAI